MSRPRKPIELHRLSGADKKNPQRYQGEVPKSDTPFGEYPAEVIRDIKSIEMDGCDKFGNPFTAPVLISSTAAPKPIMESSLGSNQQKALRALRVLHKNAEQQAELGETIRIKVSDWCGKCRDVGIDRKRWKETSNSLMCKRLIRMEGDYVYLCE